jgi:hypothetical protein
MASSSRDRAQDIAAHARVDTGRACGAARGSYQQLSDVGQWIAARPGNDPGPRQSACRSPHARSGAAVVETARRRAGRSCADAAKGRPNRSIRSQLLDGFSIWSTSSVRDACGSSSVYGGSLPSALGRGADVYDTLAIRSDRLRPAAARASTAPATLTGRSRRSCWRCRQSGRVSVGIAEADSFPGVLATSPTTRRHQRGTAWRPSERLIRIMGGQRSDKPLGPVGDGSCQRAGVVADAVLKAVIAVRPKCDTQQVDPRVACDDFADSRPVACWTPEFERAYTSTRR